MDAFRLTSLRSLIALLCLLASIVSWQSSAANEVYVEHKHCVSHDDNHRHTDHDHDDGHHIGDHHCPNCSTPFVGLTSSIAAFAGSPLNSYQDFLTDHSLIRAEAPPTPPPNS